MKKRFITFITAAVLLLTVFAVQADTTTTPVVKDYDYYVNNPDGSICGVTVIATGQSLYDCWYPW